MSAKAKREQNRRELRALILDAAREAVVRNGVENLSMRKLAQAIGYSPGTLYLHFKDKDELLHCVVEESFARLLDALQQIQDRDGGIEALRRKLRVYVDFGLRHPHHYHFAFMMRPVDNRRSRRSVPHEAFDELRNAVRECVERKQFREVDVETTSQALWAAIHGITSLLIVRSDFPWVDRDTVIEQVIETALEGLRANPDDAGGTHEQR